MKTDSLIEQFNHDAEIVIKIDRPITLSIINRKREEINNAIKQLKSASKLLENIHSEYTLSLEPK